MRTRTRTIGASLMSTLAPLIVAVLVAGGVLTAAYFFYFDPEKPKNPPAEHGFPDPTAGYYPERAVPPMKLVTDAKFTPVKQMQERLRPNELVLGVTVAGDSRAYPINMLTGPQREIINDTLGGKAIAATW